MNMIEHAKGHDELCECRCASGQIPQSSSEISAIPEDPVYCGQSGGHGSPVHACADGSCTDGVCTDSICADGAAEDHACGCCSGHDTVTSSTVTRLVVAVLLLVVGLIADGWLSRQLPGVPVWLLEAVLFGVPYILCGTSVVLEAVRSLQRGDVFNEFTLMSGATLAAMVIGALPEAAGVMVFYAIGEAVQERAAGQARASISALLAAKPEIAHVREADGSLRDTQPETLAPGVWVEVRPGEKIPLDGVVERGTARLDLSPLTGESRPVTVAAGSLVYAGTINLDSVLDVRVTSGYAQSSVARVLDMVETALARKAPTERFITRFARRYTPIVTLAAALVAIVPPLCGYGAWSEWIYRGLVLLVISCPCALVISIPLGYFGGIGAASRRGVLVKGGYVLDALRDIRVIAFDKTGTLTQGVFAVSRVLPAPGVETADLLRRAAELEGPAAHPVARSILDASRTAARAAGGAAGGEPVASVHDNPEKIWREQAGRGVVERTTGCAEGSVDAISLAGSADLLAEYGFTPPESAVRGQGVWVYIVDQGRYLGAIVVDDTLRTEAADAMAALRAEGFTLAMLTGDHPANAEPVATALGIVLVRAGLLPGDKATELAALGPVERTIFVGDGINDAPVLATAGIGVAMGGLGSQAAVEVADAVILDDSPARLVDLVRIARVTRRIVQQNIVLALSVKGAFMIFGVVGLSGLWEAVFADVGVALLAVLNATRVGRA